MLVINRKFNESIIIGDNIEIIVTEIDNDRVKLCINAPKEIPILRKELLETREFNIQSNKFLSENRDKMKLLAEKLNICEDVKKDEH